MASLVGSPASPLVSPSIAVLRPGPRAQDVLRAAPYPVGMTQLQYIDPSKGGRPLNLMLIYLIS
jgi:hypothetical protein